MLKKLRKLMQPLANTPLHPQWLASGGERRVLAYLENVGEGQIVLDVGCFDKWPKKVIPGSCAYIGLDLYETAKNWYGSVPDVYGDALKLPIKSNAINTVLLLDVLEHIDNSDMLLREVCRVLKSDGRLIMRVPFLYPLHDEPRDYIRVTRHGFRALALRNGFIVEECKSIGHPVETSALLANIAISKTMIGWMTDKNPAAILILFLLPYIVINNLIARMIATISKEDIFMPFSYELLLRKDSKVVT